MGKNEGAIKALQYRAVRALARLLPDGFQCMSRAAAMRVVRHVSFTGRVTGTRAIQLNGVRPAAGRPTVPVATHAATPRHLAATSEGGCSR